MPPVMCIYCRDTVAVDGFSCAGCLWRAALGLIAGLALQAFDSYLGETDDRRLAETYLEALDAIADLLTEHAEQRAQLLQAIEKYSDERRWR